MELAERYKAGLREFEEAFKGFEKGLTIDIFQYSPVEADLIKNGCIQKLNIARSLHGN